MQMENWNTQASASRQEGSIDFLPCKKWVIRYAPRSLKKLALLRGNVRHALQGVQIKKLHTDLHTDQ